MSGVSALALAALAFLPGVVTGIILAAVRQGTWRRWLPLPG